MLTWYREDKPIYIRDITDSKTVDDVDVREYMYDKIKDWQIKHTTIPLKCSILVANPFKSFKKNLKSF